MKDSQEIQDMINNFNLGESPSVMANKMLNIMEALNGRIDAAERTANKAAREAKGEMNEN